MKIAALERRQAGTLAYDRILEAGLRAVGLGNVVERTLGCDNVVTKEDVKELEFLLLAEFGFAREESGAKTRALGSKTRTERPSVDARLHVAMKIAALERRERGTLAYDRILEAGLRTVGLGDVVERALSFDKNLTKEDLAELELALLAEFGLAEEERMAS
ncbi:hypothetical protein BS329_15635 [Amycolatopsis coloradensis]|uniref:Uncharacterized protein n=2 Tax=Amycolatopsis coloradensis TaxID=76021 RepID=A0A1R0KUD6_9PSEU|nr:hypothetical protein BS329_15635 [Amycolatopsis coloradensis]